MIEHIINGDKEIAIIIRGKYRNDGIKFLTPDTYSQQIGYMSRPKGYVIQPHVHNAVAREVLYTKEVLFIKSGIVRVDFYGNDQRYIESRILNGGDFILLAFGGHGFEILEASEIIEVKQGPYAGDEDKTRFQAVLKDKVLIKYNYESY